MRCVFCCLTCVMCFVVTRSSVATLLKCLARRGPVQGSTGGYPLSVPGYPAPVFYPKTRPAPADFGVMPNSCRALGWFLSFMFSIDGSQPCRKQDTHWTRTTTIIRTLHITHHTSHTSHAAHSTPEWMCASRVLLGVQEELGTRPIAVPNHYEIMPKIGIEISKYQSIDIDNIVSIDVSANVGIDTQPYQI